MITFGKGGVHPPEMKLTSGMPIVDIDLPRKVTVLMAQSLGRPAKETVAKGQHVTRYEKIAEAQGPISANIHAPISGTVKEIGTANGSDGRPCPAVTIEADDTDHFADLQAISDARPRMTVEQAALLKPDEIIDIIREAGIVGLGGATFPTAVKLAPSKAGKAEILLINGSECEPYLTCDEAIMREMASEVIEGVRLMMKAANVHWAKIGIESNKPAAIKAMTDAAHPYRGITVVPLKTRYPEGGEKMLTAALTGREIKSGQLPITEGVIIQNVATALAVYHAVIWGIPLVERVMTISGLAFEKRGNYRVTMGTSVKDLIDSLGGVPESTVKIVYGGTMMGRAAADLQGPTVKGTGGILFLTGEETNLDEPGPCVKCAKCVDACPMGLEPYMLARLSELGNYEEASRRHIMDCMECGCCSYSCIARRRLVDWIRVGKAALRR